MKFIFFILLCSLANAEVYKWVDDKGKTHFSDTKPVGGAADVVGVQSVNSMSAIETRKPQTPVVHDQVVMYETSWCGYCKKARNYFRTHGVPFKAYNIERSKKAKKQFDALGGSGVPLILYGGQRMSGFSEKRFQQMYSAKRNKPSRLEESS